MSRELLNRLTGEFDQFDRERDCAEMIGSLVLLYTRIAAGLEEKEEGYERFGEGDPTGKVWEEANCLISEFVRLDPEKAFGLGVSLSILPRVADDQQERVREWSRGSGLVFLALDENVERLDQYLMSGDKREEIRGYLERCLNLDVSHIKSFEDTHTPEGFSFVQTVYLGLGLGKAQTEAGKRMYQMALEQRDDPKNEQTFVLYASIPDCSYLVERLFHTNSD
jgi:hypothetical protein